MSNDAPTTDDGFTLCVIEDGGDGPFSDGEIVVCAPLPGRGVREIGGMGRKPLKWPSVDYELFGSIQAAADHVYENHRYRRPGWVPQD